MSTLKSTLVSILVVALVSLGLTGCTSKEEPTPPADAPIADVQAQQTDDQATPTEEQPAAEHPAGEHPE